ncbi:MAG: hypothetical protein K8R53_07890, partial [Bacteroidales bacterium]|nr:hypothetical protein [Bacteroidales bacterium]
MKFLLRTLLLVFAIQTLFIAKSQPVLPPAGQIFVDTLVPRIDIFINPDTLQWIYENPDSNIEFHADFIFD